MENNVDLPGDVVRLILDALPLLGLARITLTCTSSSSALRQFLTNEHYIKCILIYLIMTHKLRGSPIAFLLSFSH